MDNKKIVNRLKRLTGQLNKIQEDIESGKDCSEVIIQFQAAKGALSASFEEYVRMALDECTEKDEQKIKRLISILVKV
jgi:DNA-binding FrmR family transcriptional regulator